MTAYPENQFIPDIPDDEYHKPNGYVSSSQLKILLKSPAHFQHDLNSEHQETPALAIGRAVHCLALEPEKYPERFAHLPEGINRRTKAGQETYAEFLEHAEGKIILKAEEAQQVACMVNAIEAHPAAANILHSKHETLIENSAFCTDINGAKFKFRPDICIPELDLIADCKTSLIASPYGFQREIPKFHYHLSAAMYAYGYQQVTGRKLKSSILIVVEKAAPYAVAVYELDEEAMQAGYRLYREAIDLYNECTRTGHWPGYSDQVESISLRPWALNKGGREE
jgi:hypothetical protein